MNFISKLFLFFNVHQDNVLFFRFHLQIIQMNMKLLTNIIKISKKFIYF